MTLRTLGTSAAGGSGLTDVATTATTNGALVVGKHNPVDATSGNRTMTIADATSAGKMITVSKKDATANTITVSVAHLRDGGAGSITLAGQYEALQLVSKADGSWWPVGDHKTKSYLDANYLTRARRFSALPAQPVATGGGVMLTATTSTVSVGYTSRQAYKVAVDCTDLQLVFPFGWYLSSPGTTAETAVTVQLPTVKAAIELADGTIWPVYFKGARTASVDPNGQIVSDPIAIEIAAGTVVYVRTFIGATSTNAAQYVAGAPTTGPGITYSGVNGYSASGDFADSGGSYTSVLNSSMWAPIMCGQPTGVSTALVGIVGDSISVGTGSNNGNSPFWKYALNNTLPVVQYGRSGIFAQGIAANHRRGFPLLQGLTHAIVMLGTNDAGSRTLAQLQADLGTIWTALTNRGIKVYACTLIPGTTSTDSWATTANQTVKSSETVRVQINDWIRTTPSPLAGYFETADTVETSRNSGKFKVNGTTFYATPDGTHPSDVAHQLMGAAISLTAFIV